jgi:hypothetical protein
VREGYDANLMVYDKVVAIPQEVCGAHEEGEQKQEPPRTSEVVRWVEKLRQPRGCPLPRHHFFRPQAL